MDRQFFIGVAGVALAFAGIWLLWWPWLPSHEPIAVQMWWFGGPLVGMGIGLPIGAAVFSFYKRHLLGAVVGSAAALWGWILEYYVVLWMFGHMRPN